MAKPTSIQELKAAIVENLNELDEDQLSMLFDIVEELNPSGEPGKHWDDPEFVAEMDRRVGDWKAGRNMTFFETAESAIDSLNQGAKK